MQQDQSCTGQTFDGIHSLLFLIRQIQLSINSLILLLIIISIIIRKQYKQTITRISMYYCICYFIGMTIVLTHNTYYITDNKIYFDNQYPKLTDILNDMYNGNGLALCGLEGFINLFFYDLAYFFAVLVTYYIYHIGKGQQQNFTMKMLKNVKTWAFILFMVLVYLVPFILMFVPNYDDKNINYFYSYAPTGFLFKDQNHQNCQANLIMYCGINSKSQTIAKIIAIVNVYFISAILMIIHIILFCKNRRYIKTVQLEQYKTDQQQLFLIWNKISFAVLGIQIYNFSKLVISLIGNNIQSNKGMQVFIIVLNYIFDMYPWMLLFFYVRYMKKSKPFVNMETLIESQ